MVADHLSRLVNQEVTVKEKEFSNKFPNVKLLVVQGNRGQMKCEIFPLALKKTVLFWFQELKQYSIVSSRELAQQLSSHLTTSQIELVEGNHF